MVILGHDGGNKSNINQGGIVNHGYSSDFSHQPRYPLDDPLGIRLEDCQRRLQKPQTFRGRTVDEIMGDIYTNIALAHAARNYEWGATLPEITTRMQQDSFIVWPTGPTGVFSRPQNEGMRNSSYAG